MSYIKTLRKMTLPQERKTENVICLKMSNKIGEVNGNSILPNGNREVNGNILKIPGGCGEINGNVNSKHGVRTLSNGNSQLGGNASEKQNKNYCTRLREMHQKTQLKLNKLSKGMQDSMDTSFLKLAKVVSESPYVVILTCFIITIVASLGSFNFTTELRPFRLWLPQNSDFIKIMNWHLKEFPSKHRRNVAIFESENILSSSSIKNMLEVSMKVKNAKEDLFGKTWADKCFRVPTLSFDEEENNDYELGVLPGFNIDTTNLGILDVTGNENINDNNDTHLVRKRRQAEDLSIILGRSEYCGSIDQIDEICFERSILEIWDYDLDIINNLNDSQILKDLKEAKISNVFGYATEYEKFLGGVTKDADGNVISAKAAFHQWITEIDEDEVLKGEYTIDAGNGQSVDNTGMSWENKWTQIILNSSQTSNDFVTYANAASSFGEVSDDNIHADVFWLTLGTGLMYIFVNFTLGKRNMVEQRPVLSVLGILSIGQAVAIYYGICSAIGIPFTPTNSIIPIILLGLGVDDMFVIMAAWEDAHHITDLTERAVITMKHASTAITVTSLTDVTAFLVSATTDLPALRSFCIYAAVGIFAVYIFQITYFLAFVIIDEKRIKSNRNGLIWCYKHSDTWKSSSCSQKNILKIVFKHYTNILLKTPVRIIILIISTVLLTLSIYGATKLHREFNPMWFIPNDSYLFKWFQTNDYYFKGGGENGYVFIENATFPNDLENVQKLFDNLEQLDSVSNTSFWYKDLLTYIDQNSDFSGQELDQDLFDSALSVFLHSSSGGNYVHDFKFSGQLTCSDPAPKITLLRVPITIKFTLDADMQSTYRGHMENVIRNSNVGSNCAIWAETFSIWETNEIVGSELWRNLMLSIAVIGIITLLLLTSVWASVLVMLCVFATLTGVACSIWLWGLTIDTVSCLTLVLSVGISVDYAVHVAFAYLVSRTTDKSSVEVTFIALNKVGPAVLLGGSSTLLAFALLFGSSSHVFQTFFKIFTTSSVLGLYWGLVALPVILSFLPKPTSLDR